MSRPRMRHDEEFWHIVKHLRWRLEDGNGGFPVAEPEFGYGRGPGRAWPMWSTHLAAFVLGAITFGLLFVR